jgi:hypothetical protein
LSKREAGNFVLAPDGDVLICKIAK